LDGAAIHLDIYIVFYLRSFGIHVIWNAAYCSFYSPIEFLIGYIKADLQKNYKEIPGTELRVICDTFAKFCDYDMNAVFRKCGYGTNGRFDPFTNLHW